MMLFRTLYWRIRLSKMLFFRTIESLLLLLTLLFFAVNYSHAQVFTNSIAGTGLDIPNGEIKNVIDYDNDGYEDIIYYTTDNLLAPSLFKNNRNGKYINISAASGFPALSGTDMICVFDYDNNGYQDLLVFDGTNSLRFFKNSSGSFTETTNELGIKNPFFDQLVAYNSNYSFGFTFSDYDKDGDLDVFLNTQLPDQTSSIQVLVNEIYPKGSFNTLKTVVEGYPVNTNLMHYLIDYDNDADDDLLILTVDGTSFGSFAYQTLKLYKNDHGVFSDVTNGSGLTLANPFAMASVFDYNNDGFLDILFGTTDQSFNGAPYNTFFQNNGNGTFSDISQTKNMRDGDFYFYTSRIFDFDNDADFDAIWGQSCYGSFCGQFKGATFYVNDNYNFTESASTYGLNLKSNPELAPNPTIMDFNNDGLLDVFGFGASEGPFLMQNNTSTSDANYLNIKLVGCISPRDAYGARVVVKAGGTKLTQYSSGEKIGSNALGSSRIFHFGLKSSTVADSVIVYWTSGMVTRMRNVAANQKIIIYETPIPSKPTFQNPDPICAGQSITLEKPQKPSSNYFWYTDSLNGNSHANPFSTGPLFSNQSFFLIDSLGPFCKSPRTPVQVKVKPMPSPPTYPDTSICVGKNLLLNKSSFPNTYYWATDTSTGTVYPNPYTPPTLNPNNYFYLMSDVNQCKSKWTTVNVKVNVVPSKPVFGSISTCFNEPIILSKTDPIATGSYYWYTSSDGGTPFANPLTLNIQKDDLYYLADSISGGCSSERTPVPIRILSSIPTPAYPSTSVCLGESITLEKTNPAAYGHYYWYTELNGSSAIKNKISVVAPNTNTTYYLIDSLSANCKSQRLPVTILVEDCSKTPIDTSNTVFFPNGFSPNNDGVNDFYTIFNVPKDVIVSVVFFDRWGDVVYKNDNYQNDWAGKCDSAICLGQSLPSSTYFMKASLSNGQKYSVNVTLIR